MHLKMPKRQGIGGGVIEEGTYGKMCITMPAPLPIRTWDVANEIQKGITSCYDPAMCILSYQCHMPAFFSSLVQPFHPSSLHIRI